LINNTLPFKNVTYEDVEAEMNNIPESLRKSHADSARDALTILNGCTSETGLSDTLVSQRVTTQDLQAELDNIKELLKARQRPEVRNTGSSWPTERSEFHGETMFVTTKTRGFESVF